MKHKIIRIFHPVGQGAFYSERHEFENIRFNIVYDCGSIPEKNLKVDATVKSSFMSDDEIDILFISHFDKDHVNKIDILRKTVKNIKNVIYPLLDNSQINILKSIYSNDDDSKSIISLIEDPQTFFGNDVNLISIKPAKISPLPDSQDFKDVLILDNKEGGEYESGTKFILKIDKSSCKIIWQFIPYNFQFSSRSFILKTEIINASSTGVASKDLCERLLDGILITDPNELAIINNIYRNCLSNDVNENSMFVYSGPDSFHNVARNIFVSGESCYMRNKYCYLCDDITLASDRIGCLYTGDGDFKLLVKNGIDIKNLLPRNFQYVGVVQVPHHGSKNDFDINFFGGGTYYCPISFGNQNSYGHPSSHVITELLLYASFPVLVSDDHGSIFVQKVIIYNN